MRFRPMLLLIFSFLFIASLSHRKLNSMNITCTQKKAVERLCMYGLHALTFDCTYIIIHQRLSSWLVMTCKSYGLETLGKSKFKRTSQLLFPKRENLIFCWFVRSCFFLGRSVGRCFHPQSERHKLKSINNLWKSLTCGITKYICVCVCVSWYSSVRIFTLNFNSQPAIVYTQTRICFHIKTILGQIH